MEKNEAIDITIKELDGIIQSLLEMAFEQTPMGQWAMKKSMALHIGITILEEQKDDTEPNEE